MKASKAQMIIAKQQKAILNILLYMLKEGVSLSEEEVQAIMQDGSVNLNTAPITPAKKPKMSAQEIAEKQANDIAHIESLAKKTKKAQKPKQEVKKTEQVDEVPQEVEKEDFAVPPQEDDGGWGSVDGNENVNPLDNVNPLPTV